MSIKFKTILNEFLNFDQLLGIFKVSLIQKGHEVSHWSSSANNTDRASPVQSALEIHQLNCPILVRHRLLEAVPQQNERPVGRLRLGDNDEQGLSNHPARETE